MYFEHVDFLHVISEYDDHVCFQPERTCFDLVKAFKRKVKFKILVCIQILALSVSFVTDMPAFIELLRKTLA